MSDVNRKLRILSVGEASFVSSGFGTYNWEVLRRLHATGKYEIAELACYGTVGDPRTNRIPWLYYANAITDGDPRGGQYNSNPINQWGAWRLERTLLDFKADCVAVIRDPWFDEFIFHSPFRKYFHLVAMPTYDSCFVKNTHVITKTGIKHIEDINIGEQVLTHDSSYQKVSKVYKLDNNKPLVEITTNGCAIPVTMTNDHPVLVIQKERQKWTHTSRRHRSVNHYIEKAKYINAQHIKNGDYLVFPAINCTNDIEELDILSLLSDYPRKFYIDKTSCYTKNSNAHIPKTIPLNNDVLQLFGWFIAEGYVEKNNKSKLSFSLNGSTEQHHLKFIEKTLYKYFNVKPKRKKHKNSLCEEVYIHNTLLNHIFRKLFGKNCYYRQIPEFCMELPKHKLVYLLVGMFYGDGTDTHTVHGKRTIAYSTASKILAFQTFQALLKLGVLSSLSKSGNSYDVQVLNHYGQKLAEYFKWPDGQYKFSTHNNTNSWIDNHGNAIMRVKTVKPINKKVNTVYNLQVENNNTFVTSFIVHNCPYQDQWVDNYINADAIFTYTEWASECLMNDAGGKLNLLGHASPGVDLEVFKPAHNIKAHRQNMGFMPDIFLIGTVMRNQKRKLFPDLLDAFKLFLQKCHEKGRDDIAQKTFLYFHTSYPDRGWQMPELLKNSGLGHKVVFTYICQSCAQPFCAFFQDARTMCPHCNQVNAILPNVSAGLSREQLAAIYQMFDCYVQYAIAGGIEMPAIEAGACGVVPFEVDYAGMSSAVRNLNGIPLKIDRMFLELETGAYRVYPDNNYLAEQLYQFLIKPTAIRQKMGYATRQGAEKHYNWDNIAKKWEDYFDNMQLTGLQGKWDSPPNIHNVPNSIPSNLSNKDFVKWLIINVMNDPTLLNTYFEINLLRELNYGARINGMNVEKLTREQVFEQCRQRAIQQNECEQVRCGLLPATDEDYIRYAHERFTV